MFAVWGLVAVALVVVATYRSFLAKDETDQIIVSQAESRPRHAAAESHRQTVSAGPFVKGLSWTSGGLVV
jgi:hypothetical protein